MFDCDLSRSKFDGARGDRNSFAGSTLQGSSFKQSKFRHTGFRECDCRNACFDSAWLFSAGFHDADLRGASFRGAYLNGAVFVGANLAGCDFRGADMQEAVIYNVTVDSTTDFRGANLVNAYMADHYNKAGELTGKGLNLSACQLDATTRLGADPKLHALEVLNAALEIAAERRDTPSLRVHQAIQRVLTEIQKDYFEDWYDRVISYLAPEERDAHDEIMDEAYRSLL
jgi:uncharacterized protein YjbI with pentapeptide repeats